MARGWLGRHDRLGQRWDVVFHTSVDGDFFCRSGGAAESVVYGRALDGQGRLLVTGQFGNRWLVKTGPGVNVRHVGHFVGFRRLSGGVMLLLVLTSGGKQQTAVGGKGETAEEGGEGLVGIESRRLGGGVHASAYAGRGSGHDSR